MCENVPKDTVLGFDLEWKPNYQKGVPPNKVALVRLCYLDEEQSVAIHLVIGQLQQQCLGLSCPWHVRGIQKALENIPSDSRFKKAGLGSTQDSKLIKRDFDMTMEGVEDIGAISTRKNLSGVIEPGKSTAAAPRA